VFGISFLEIGLIAVVALVVVGPQKLPGMLFTLGQWVRKLRRLSTEMRAQSGIDDILRQEGLHGGLTELRGLVRGDVLRQPAARYASPASAQPPNEATQPDPTREFPPEGVDAGGALPDDLVDDGEELYEEDTPPEADDSAAAKAADDAAREPAQAAKAADDAASEPTQAAKAANYAAREQTQTAKAANEPTPPAKAANEPAQSAAGTSASEPEKPAPSRRLEPPRP
jgi:sec-independent protein translocase protein TatB